jgi:ABC-type multidrug transport system fused ATPase/permease subunit
MHKAQTGRPWYQAWHGQILMAEVNQRGAPTEELPDTFKLLEFDGVDFTFPGAGAEPVLKGVNLRIHQGECVAIVGASGGGKTTFLDLATGLLMPTVGRVALNDGPSLHSVASEEWQCRLGVVLQDSPLFHDSVLRNITWGHETVDEDRARVAAEHANAWEFISRLPKGLHTVVGERGGRLSGGQKQRLALARALYRDPWLLILDEATSALDSTSEDAIRDSLRTLKGSVTMMIVAHRISALEIADRVLVIEGGMVVEDGPYDTLMADSSSTLAQMAARQRNTSERT